jgi:hypothetical protein
MTVLGVDPGAHGAVAVYDPQGGRVLEIADIPYFTAIVANKERRRLDPVALLDLAGRLRRDYAPVLVTLEQVSARPDQGAASTFTFGWSAGAIWMAFTGFRYRVEFAAPSAWKRALGVPSKLDGNKLGRAICVRADQIFPDNRELWRGPRGGALHDRAEAAMLAKYGAEKWLMTSRAC